MYTNKEIFQHRCYITAQFVCALLVKIIRKWENLNTKNNKTKISTIQTFIEIL